MGLRSPYKHYKKIKIAKLLDMMPFSRTHPDLMKAMEKDLNKLTLVTLSNLEYIVDKVRAQSKK